MRTYVRTVETLEMDGGWLCLDFINTIRHRFETPPHDYLNDYRHFITWALRKKLITQAEAARIRQEEESPAAAQARRAGIEVRETLYQLFRAVVHQSAPAPETLTRFNQQLQTAHRHLTIAVDSSRNVREEWPRESLQYPLYPIIKSAYDLLKSDYIDRVKECPACGWLFLDRSKNGSRRWCNMQTCGSSAKSKRYYHKNREELT